MTVGTAINGGRLASWFFDDRMSGGVASDPSTTLAKEALMTDFELLSLVMSVISIVIIVLKK